MPETIQDTITLLVLLSLFGISIRYCFLAFRQCSRFIKWLHQHRHHDWIKLGAPNAPFWKGEVRKNHRATHRTDFNSFSRMFRESSSIFLKKYNEEEAQQILNDYLRYHRLSAFSLTGFICGVFIAAVVSAQ